MINRRSTFFLGIFIFIIPFLGVPSSWKTSFIVTSGIVLVVLSIKITLPKRPLKTRTRKEKVTQVFVESMPAREKENIVDGIIAPNSATKTDATENHIE